MASSIGRDGKVGLDVQGSNEEIFLEKAENDDGRWNIAKAE